MNPIFTDEETEDREAKKPAQGHTASKSKSQVESRQLGSRARALSAVGSSSSWHLPP